MNEHTLSAALKAAGAGVMAVDLIMNKKVDNAFCAVRPPGHHAERDQAMGFAVRPPGHHAERDQAMGFCFFNNIAVAAAHALEEHNLERVAIIDFDVHHGNGTEDIFMALRISLKMMSALWSAPRMSTHCTLTRAAPPFLVT